MKLKLEKLVNSQETLGLLFNEKLPITLSYKISLLIKKIRPELEAYEKVRSEKIKELGVKSKDKDGKENGNYELDQSNKEVLDKFIQEMRKVVDQEVSIEIPEIKIEEFDKAIELTPLQMENIDWIIK